MRENRKWLVCTAVILDFPTKQDVVIKMNPRVLRFSALLLASAVCKVAILDFSAIQDIVLKIKETCHLEHKTPEQMPFKFL